MYDCDSVGNVSYYALWSHYIHPYKQFSFEVVDQVNFTSNFRGLTVLSRYVEVNDGKLLTLVYSGAYALDRYGAGRSFDWYG